MTRTAIEGEFRSNLHQGGRAEAVKLTADERKTAVAAAAALGLNVAGGDMLRSTEGPMIMEGNSPPGLEGIERGTARDVARGIIMYLQRHRRPSAPDRVRV